MNRDQRKAKRRLMRYTAWLARKPGDLLGCVLSDISDTGARMTVQEPDTVPDRFLLMLSRNGKAKRLCRVVWRKDKQLGVHFETKLAAANPTASGGVASPPLAPAADTSAEPAPVDKA